MTKLYTSGEFTKKTGHLVIIGGGYRPDYLMREFVRLSGGYDSQITILPAASRHPEVIGEEIKRELENLGCKYVNCIYSGITSADEEINLTKLEKTKGIFFSGGDQNKLARFLLGTKMLDRIRDIYYNGGAIAGTSAGAAIMSKVMIAGYTPDFDDSIDTTFQAPFPARSVRLSEGVGFLNDIIIDQHFNTRNRIERLKDAVKRNPAMLGIGIDESTAIIVNTDNTFHVVGENKVTLFSLNDFGLIQKIDKAIELLNSGKAQILNPGEKYLFNSFISN